MQNITKTLSNMCCCAYKSKCNVASYSEFLFPIQLIELQFFLLLIFYCVVRNIKLNYLQLCWCWFWNLKWKYIGIIYNNKIPFTGTKWASRNKGLHRQYLLKTKLDFFFFCLRWLLSNIFSTYTSNQCDKQ